jgi:hypothetical protein
MVVSRDFVRCFQPGYKTRYDIKFHQYPWAWYHEYRKYERGGTNLYQPAPTTPLLTAGYLVATKVQTPEWPDGPRVVAAFGMGGTESWVLASLLRRNYQELMRGVLESPEGRLVMMELSAPEPPPLEAFFRPKFAECWTGSVILDVTT